MSMKKVVVGTLLACVIAVTLVTMVIIIGVGRGTMQLIGQMTAEMPDPSAPAATSLKPNPASAKAIHKGGTAKGPAPYSP